MFQIMGWIVALVAVVLLIAFLRAELRSKEAETEALPTYVSHQRAGAGFFLTLSTEQTWWCDGELDEDSNCYMWWRESDGFASTEEEDSRMTVMLQAALAREEQRKPLKSEDAA